MPSGSSPSFPKGSQSPYSSLPNSDLVTQESSLLPNVKKKKKWSFFFSGLDSIPLPLSSWSLFHCGIQTRRKKSSILHWTIHSQTGVRLWILRLRLVSVREVMCDLGKTVRLPQAPQRERFDKISSRGSLGMTSKDQCLSEHWGHAKLWKWAGFLREKPRCIARLMAWACPLSCQGAWCRRTLWAWENSRPDVATLSQNRR